MLDFKEQNDKERAFFEQDFSAINEVLHRVRKSLITGENLSITDLDLSDIINFDRAETLVYITLFQSGQKFIRYGSKRQDFQSTLNRDVEMLRKNKKFSDFDVSGEVKCRIMLEYVIDRHPVSPAKLNSVHFDNSRFEIGINGLELRKDGISYYYMPTDAITLSHMGLRSVEKLQLPNFQIVVQKGWRYFRNQKIMSIIYSEVGHLLHIKMTVFHCIEGMSDIPNLVMMFCTIR